MEQEANTTLRAAAHNHACWAGGLAANALCAGERIASTAEMTGLMHLRTRAFEDAMLDLKKASDPAFLLGFVVDWAALLLRWSVQLQSDHDLGDRPDGYIAWDLAPKPPEKQAEQPAREADPDNDEFQCDQCGEILDNDDSIRVFKDELYCRQCVLFMADITCQTPGCAKYDRVVNTVTVTRDPDMTAEETEDGFYEGWRGEDPADKCPECGHIGLLRDPRYPER